MKKILIIEDDAVTASIYRRNLERAGFEVALAPDGQAGLESIEQWSPDAVLLDVMMPQLSGINMLKMLRALPSGSALPVVVMTNAYVPQVVNEARAAGANQVLAKGTLTSNSLATAFREALAA